MNTTPTTYQTLGQSPISLTVLGDAYRFTRFSAMSFSILVPCLGAITATQALTLNRTLMLVSVAVVFHLFAYISNDIADLDIDRTQPLRAYDPLVRGAITPNTALAFALVQVPLAFVISATADGTWRAYVSLACAFVGMSIYNVFGKRSTPLLMDAIQAAAWGALVLYGAFMVASGITLATVILFACVFVYILMINGVHGAVRDLDNDRKCGARTTAILMGADESNAGQIATSKTFRWYAFALYASFLALLTAPFLVHHPQASLIALWLSFTLYALLAGISVVLLIAALSAPRDKRSLLTLGMFHLLMSIALLMIPFLPGLNLSVTVTLAVAYLLPVMAMLSPLGFRW